MFNLAQLIQSMLEPQATMMFVVVTLCFVIRTHHAIHKMRIEQRDQMARLEVAARTRDQAQVELTDSVNTMSVMTVISESDPTVTAYIPEREDCAAMGPSTGNPLPVHRLTPEKA